MSIRQTILNASTVLTCTGLLAAQGIGGGMVVEDAATAIVQKLGAPIAKDAKFKDAAGNEVTIGDYLAKGQPVILNLQFFGCKTLCGPILNGLLAAMEATPFELGKDVRVLSVSFDHREQPELAKWKKKSVVDHFKRPGADKAWHFLSGDRENILKLTKSVGYGFRWNETRQDFDHRAAILFIAPSGKITRYLRGAAYDDSTFRLAIVEASEGTVGTAMDRFVLSCYGYDPLTGTYSRIGPMAMATGGALTLGGLAILLFVLFRRERRDRRQVAPVAAS